MDSPVEIRCRLSGVFPVMMIGMIGLFTVIIIGVVVSGETEALFSFGLVIAFWWFAALYLTFYEVALHEDGELEFKAVLRTIRLKAFEIESIGSGGFDPQSVLVRTRYRKVRILRSMTNMFDLGTRLRELNPSIDLSSF